jgi:hypothetical protein
MANKNPTLDVLQKAVKGLTFSSESDAPLEAFVWDEERSLTKKKILDLAGVEGRQRDGGWRDSCCFVVGGETR